MDNEIPLASLSLMCQLEEGHSSVVGCSELSPSMATGMSTQSPPSLLLRL